MRYVFYPSDEISLHEIHCSKSDLDGLLTIVKNAINKSSQDRCTITYYHAKKDEINAVIISNLLVDATCIAIKHVYGRLVIAATWQILYEFQKQIEDFIEKFDNLPNKIYKLSHIYMTNCRVDLIVNTGGGL